MAKVGRNQHQSSSGDTATTNRQPGGWRSRLSPSSWVSWLAGRSIPKKRVEPKTSSEQTDYELEYAGASLRGKGLCENPRGNGSQILDGDGKFFASINDGEGEISFHGSFERGKFKQGKVISKASGNDEKIVIEDVAEGVPIQKTHIHSNGRKVIWDIVAGQEFLRSDTHSAHGWQSWLSLKGWASWLAAESAKNARAVQAYDNINTYLSLSVTAGLFAYSCMYDLNTTLAFAGYQLLKEVSCSIACGENHKLSFVAGVSVDVAVGYLIGMNHLAASVMIQKAVSQHVAPFVTRRLPVNETTQAILHKGITITVTTLGAKWVASYLHGDNTTEECVKKALAEQNLTLQYKVSVDPNYTPPKICEFSGEEVKGVLSTLLNQTSLAHATKDPLGLRLTYKTYPNQGKVLYQAELNNARHFDQAIRHPDYEPWKEVLIIMKNIVDKVVPRSLMSKMSPFQVGMWFYREYLMMARFPHADRYTNDGYRPGARVPGVIASMSSQPLLGTGIVKTAQTIYLDTEGYVIAPDICYPDAFGNTPSNWAVVMSPEDFPHAFPLNDEHEGQSLLLQVFFQILQMVYRLMGKQETQRASPRVFFRVLQTIYQAQPKIPAHLKIEEVDKIENPLRSKWEIFHLKFGDLIPSLAFSATDNQFYSLRFFSDNNASRDHQNVLPEGVVDEDDPHSSSHTLKQ